MKIAIGATLHKKVRKDATGGTEIFVYELTRELVRRGHAVTVFASSDSQVPGELVGIADEEHINSIDQGQRLFYGYQLLESQEIALRASEFDVIHINYFESFLFAPFSKLIGKPILYTVHSDLFDSQQWQHYINKTVKPNDRFVFVSQSAAARATEIKNKTHIYNGIDMTTFPFSDKPNDYFFWIGRVRKKKGIKEAVEFAVQSKLPLIVSGVIDNSEEKIFFDTEVMPLIQKNSHIQYIGSVGFAEKIRYYQQAKALLVPISWEEPFGLTMVEAMVCGTPVIAFNRGAVSEVIQDGITGYIIDPDDVDRQGKGSWVIKKQGVAGLIDAASQLENIHRSDCRAHAERNFSLKRMVDEYEKLYQEMTRNV